MSTHADAYASAGVDIEAGAAAVEMMRPHVARTQRPEVVALPGGFAGGFALDVARWREPVLVSGTDGVGTKLLVAAALERFDTIGIDAVAMCVNDIAVYGAEPLYFLDYLATGVLDPAAAADVVAGVAEGCVQAGCALLGGETAEMPGMYAPGHADVAGFAVGVVERGALPDPSLTQAGDVLVGLASSGLHSNGYSLARQVLLGDLEGAALRAQLEAFEPELGRPLGDELLEPTRIYAPVARELAGACDVRAMAHITGGGFAENLGRVLHDGIDAQVAAGTWPVPAIFELLRTRGELDHDTLHRVFNMGVGFVAVVPATRVDRACTIAADHGIDAWPIGVLTEGSGRVVVADPAQAVAPPHPDEETNSR